MILIVKNWKIIWKELLEFLSSFLEIFFKVMFEGTKVVTTFWVCEGFGSKNLDQYKTKRIDHD